MCTKGIRRSVNRMWAVHGSELRLDIYRSVWVCLLLTKTDVAISLRLYSVLLGSVRCPSSSHTA